MIRVVSRVFQLGYAPFLDTINLKVDPPNPRYTKYEPQRRFLS